MDILDRIVALLNTRNQKELCDYLKLDKSAVTSWKNGSSKSYRKYLIEIAEFFNVSIDYLVYGKEKNSSAVFSADEYKLLECYNKLLPKEQQRLIGRAEMLVDLFSEVDSTSQNKPAITMKTISIADVAAGAGISTPFTIDNAFSEQEFPADEIPTGADCGVPINGDSMKPEHPNGCIVWVKQNADINYEDCIIAAINEEPFFKIYKPDELHSYNANYKPIMVNDSDQFEIFGKVIGYYSVT